MTVKVRLLVALALEGLAQPALPIFFDIINVGWGLVRLSLLICSGSFSRRRRSWQLLVEVVINGVEAIEVRPLIRLWCTKTSTPTCLGRVVVRAMGRAVLMRTFPFFGLRIGNLLRCGAIGCGKLLVGVIQIEELVPLGLVLLARKGFDFLDDTLSDLYRRLFDDVADAAESHHVARLQDHALDSKVTSLG